jgi:predicted aldo/keto reductase-like oxidoreductase
VKYRTFGRLDWKSSALGFGAMRLPRIDNDPGQIDEPEATRLIRYAIDHGVNYVDTAYPYHRETSETFLGRALQDGYRERIRLATKLPCWKVEKEEDFDRFLDEQLGKLQTEHVDFYLLHSLDAKTWPKMRDLGVLRWAEGAVADGRIGHLGFSFHDKVEVFREIVDASDLWTLCQMQRNFMDVEYQAGTEGLRYAAGKGLAVVIMEPLRGGMLTQHVPPSVQALWDSVGATHRGRPRAGTEASPYRRTPAAWALQWLWNQPEISVVLSGMSTMEQVVENVASAARSGPGTMSEEELAVISRVREQYEALCAIPCTACEYCLPCPNGVSIPEIFKIYNNAMMYGDVQRARNSYASVDDNHRADLCIECGECLEKCPQGIEIPEWLKKTQELLCEE